MNVFDKSDTSPLYRASQSGRMDIVQLLLEQNANVNLRDTSRRAPLHAASHVGEMEVSRLLLQWGADVNSQDEDDFYYTQRHKMDTWISFDS